MICLCPGQAAGLVKSHLLVDEYSKFANGKICLAGDSKKESICCYTKNCAENQVKQRQQGVNLKKRVKTDAESAHSLLSPLPPPCHHVSALTI